jgi:prepilin-type N-terminal cleavage/methylation domain-containing protein
MNEAGYTLTETLAAMAVIGLAMGGLTLGMQVLGGQQSAVGATVLKAQEVRAAQAWLEGRLADHGPYRAHETGRLAGTAERLAFDCGAAANCVLSFEDHERGRRLKVFRGQGEPVSYRLPSRAPARFVYRGAGEVELAWPPAGGTRQALRSISLLQGESGREAAVFEARVWAEQPLDCAYDPVIQDCR